MEKILSAAFLGRSPNLVKGLVNASRTNPFAGSWRQSLPENRLAERLDQMFLRWIVRTKKQFHLATTKNKAGQQHWLWLF